MLFQNLGAVLDQQQLGAVALSRKAFSVLPGFISLLGFCTEQWGKREAAVAIITDNKEHQCSVLLL